MVPVSPFPCAGLGEQAAISKQVPADLAEVVLVAPLRGRGQFKELSASLDVVMSSGLCLACQKEQWQTNVVSKHLVPESS